MPQDNYGVEVDKLKRGVIAGVGLILVLGSLYLAKFFFIEEDNWYFVGTTVGVLAGLILIGASKHLASRRLNPVP